MCCCFFFASLYSSITLSHALNSEHKSLQCMYTVKVQVYIDVSLFCCDKSQKYIRMSWILCLLNRMLKCRSMTNKEEWKEEGKRNHSEAFSFPTIFFVFVWVYSVLTLWHFSRFLWFVEYLMKNKCAWIKYTVWTVFCCEKLMQCLLEPISSTFVVINTYIYKDGLRANVTIFFYAFFHRW